MRKAGWVLSMLVLAGCGGRAAQPVETIQSVDPLMTCTHIAGEFQNNQKRVAELLGERSERNRDNLGMVLLSPLMLDLSQSERKEAEAITARNRRLLELATDKSCPIQNDIAASLAPALEGGRTPAQQARK